MREVEIAGTFTYPWAVEVEGGDARKKPPSIKDTDRRAKPGVNVILLDMSCRGKQC